MRGARWHLATTTLIRQLAQHEFFIDFASFTDVRAQDRNAAAKLLLFEFGDAPASTKKSSLDTFVRSARQHPERLELAGRRVQDTLDVLTRIFLPMDRLLGSAGLIPVYYWFIRSLDERSYPLVRDFLVRFEKARRDNRQGVSLGQNVEAELLEYDGYNRSTNDLASHAGRIRILERFFRLQESTGRLFG